MREVAQFFRLRPLLVLVLFGCVLCLAHTNPHVTTPFVFGLGSPPLSFSAPPRPAESVRAELARLQEQTGLSLVWVAGGAVQIVMFSHRSRAKARDLPHGGGHGGISLDGNEVAFDVRPGLSGPQHLGISRTDGSDFREYSNIAYPAWLPSRAWDDICWSHDKAMLVTTFGKTEDVQGRNSSLQIVNLSSGGVQEIDSQGLITSQCWSPDDKQLVFEAGESVRAYDVEGKKSRVIAEGTYPTLSPDGNWIAFLGHDAYYAIHPSGTERHMLFKSRHSASGLFWSPDSRFVAYISGVRMQEGGFLPSGAETYYLRVRRLEDNSEARITYALTPFSFQWVANTELFRAAQSNIDQSDSVHPEFGGKVFLVGQVAKQGWYPLEGGGTILQVLAAAGGLTPSAKADSIYIERNENKKHLRIPFHYKKAQHGDEKDIPLKPGDVVIVP